MAPGDSGLVSLRCRQAVSLYRRAGNVRRGEGRSEAPRFDMTDGAGIPFGSSKTCGGLARRH